MTDYHVITPESVELVMRVIDGKVQIVPPAASDAFSTDQKFSAQNLPTAPTSS